MASSATPEGRVFDALMRHLYALPSRPRIVPPNTVYPTAGQAKDNIYIVVSHAPNVPLRTEIADDGEKILRGFFGMGVMTALGVGESGGSAELCGRIASHFDCARIAEGTTIVRVVGRPQVAGGYVDADRWRVPVTVEYETVRV